MKENREFDMLENADDKEVELLAEVSVLTEKEKARMKKKSRDRLNSKLEENDTGDRVSGVEHYKRPKWYSVAAVAACLVLAIGAVGTAIYLGGRGKVPDIDQLATTEPTVTTAATEAPTEAVTEAAAEEDLVKVADDLLEELIQFENFTRGYMVSTDINMTKTVESDEGTLVYERVLGCDTADEFREQYREHFTDLFLDGYSDIWDGQWADTPLFEVFDGKLYHLNLREKNEPVLYSFSANDKIDVMYQGGDEFEFMRSGLDMNDERQYFTVSCVREDGVWKIDSRDCLDVKLYFGLDSIPEGADINAFHVDMYGAVTFDKPIYEQSDATLIAAAQTMSNMAAMLQGNLYSGIYPWQRSLDGSSPLPGSETVDGEPVFYLITKEGVNTKEDVIAEYYKSFSDKYPYPEELDSLVREYDGRVYGDGFCEGYGTADDRVWTNSEIISYDGRDGDEFRFTVRDYYAGDSEETDYYEDREFTAVIGDDGVLRVGKYTLL